MQGGNGAPHADPPPEPPADCVPGVPTTVIHDHWPAATAGGCGFGELWNSGPVSESTPRAQVKNHDFVFTRFAEECWLYLT
jgi:hypothetical protein